MNIVKSVSASSASLMYIRLLAALGVLHSHSYAILTGNRDSQPVLPYINITLGTFCVHVFFALSGYLICGSALRGEFYKFMVARIARIYPALWLMLIVTVFGFGIVVSDLSADGYASDNAVWRHFLRNSVMIFGSSEQLPGVFEQNPLKRIFNGSLWTLPFELRLYAVFALFCLFFRKIQTAHRIRAFAACIVVMILISCLTMQHIDLLGGSILAGIVPSELIIIFGVGALLRVLGENLKMRAIYVATIALVMIVSLVWFSRDYSYMVYCLLIPYLVLSVVIGLGYIFKVVPSDYSYSIYLWASPVQQMLVQQTPAADVWAFSALAALIVGAISVVSWIAVERPANEWARARKLRSRRDLSVQMTN